MSLKRVRTATLIAVLVLGLGVPDHAAALPIERSSPLTPAPPPGALIIVTAGDSFASGQGAADHTGLLPAA